eukprot:5955286-Pyramimonas_sp.AAC.1
MIQTFRAAFPAGDAGGHAWCALRPEAAHRPQLRLCGNVRVVRGPQRRDPAAAPLVYSLHSYLVILLLFDPHKLDISDEFNQVRGYTTKAPPGGFGAKRGGFRAMRGGSRAMRGGFRAMRGGFRAMR